MVRKDKPKFHTLPYDNKALRQMGKAAKAVMRTM